MMQEASRKVVHYLIATSLVLLAFAVQTGCTRCRRPNATTTPTGQGKAWRALDVRLVTSATFALVLCIMKQVGDALSLTWLPWCHLFSGYYCHFEWLDLFLTVDGILTGLLLLIGLHVCANRCYRPVIPDIPCDPTVAMSVDDGADQDNDPEGVFDLTDADLEGDGDHHALPYHVDVDPDARGALNVLTASEEESPVLNATPSSLDDDPSTQTMFATLSSSPNSTSRMPLIFPSEIITV